MREYQKGDLEELLRIDSKCFDPEIAYSRAELQSYIQRKGSFSIIAEIEPLAETILSRESEAQLARKRSIAGFVVVEYLQHGYGHVITIDVLPDYRREHLGTLLLEAAEERVRKLGGFMMVLETAVDNRGALAFYKRHSYNVVRTLPRYYARKLDGLFLTKRF